MQSLPNELLQWLYRVIQNQYTVPKTTYQDTAIALQSFPTLKPRTRVFTSDQGESMLYLNLYGSLPVEINGRVYKIPVEVWVPYEYPLLQPIIYLVPTEKMMLQPGNYVDSNGKCYHPYLANWNENCNIVGICKELIKVFALEIPVFAKPKESPSPVISTPNSNTATINTITESRASPLSPPPPLPPLPTELRRIVLSPKKIKQELIEQPNIMDNDNISNQQEAGRVETLNQMNQLIQKIYDEEISKDLNKFNMNINQIKYSIDKFNKIFDYEFNNINKINSQLQENESILINSIKQADETIVKANEIGDLNIDEIIVTESIVHNQLYNLVAEDLAISDTIYALTKAFDNGKIPLQSFMKHTRNLARQQFLKKALIEKIGIALKLNNQ